jgi:N-acetylglucosamine kinase
MPVTGAAGAAMLICFDIGGSRIKAARSPAPGMVEVLGEAPTPTSDFDAFAAVLAGFLAGARALSLSVAGVADPATGRMTVANIPCLNGRAAAADLRSRLGRPVVIHNDADCFTLAEAGQGAARGHRNVFGVILGTGVGGGLVIDGRIVTGAGGYAGEWGHGPVLNAAAVPWFRCGCGQSGCVDTVGGARGIERLDGFLHGRSLGSEAILAAWAAGEPAARRTLEVWAELLSGPLAMVLNVTGASAVPVGGGLSRAPGLVAHLDRAVRARVLRQTDAALLRPAALPVEPGLIGASLAGHGAADG